MSNITYIKEQQLSIFAKSLTFTGIQVLQSAQVSFYQKYIILILQNGLDANDEDSLITVLSNMVNVNRLCIVEFIEYLIERNYLIFDERKKRYFLSPAIHFQIDSNYNNAMFAELDTKYADCDKIIYVSAVDKFYLESELDGTSIRKKGVGGIATTISQSELNEALLREQDSIRLLITKSFENTNLHLQPEFSFRIDPSREKDIQLEFPVLVQYEYSRNDNRSRRVATTMYDKSFLPQSIVDELSTKYDEDETLPRFIGFDESFYKKSDYLNKSYFDAEKAVSDNKEKLIPLKESSQQLKTKIELARAEYKKAYAVASSDEQYVLEEISKVDADIAMNEAILPDADAGLISNLRSTISELSRRKSELENQAKQSKANIELVEKTHKEKVDNLQQEIEAKKAEMDAIKRKIKRIQAEQLRMRKEYHEILKSGPNNLNGTVANVISKYPQDENVFFRRVSAICIGIDKALSASDSSAYDEFAESIDTVRESYRKVLQIVFETILQKNMQTLGTMLGDTATLLDLEKECKNRKVPPGVVSRIAVFHNLSNAIGHLAESSGKASGNAQRIKGFKTMSREGRYNIVISIPEFFENISLSNNEIQTIVRRLSL